jgi:hypothetical protein
MRTPHTSDGYDSGSNSMRQLPVISVVSPAPMLQTAARLPRLSTWLLPAHHNTTGGQQAGSNSPMVFAFVWSGAAILMMGLSTLMLTVLAVIAQSYPDGNPDPFTPYEIIVPGRSFALVMGRYRCDSDLLAPPSDRRASSLQSVCVINAGSQHFDRVMVTSRDERIREVQFLVADLQAVDLLRRWGRPDLIRRSSENYMLIWHVGVVAHAPSGRQQFSYLLPVRTVLLRPAP